MTLVASKFAWSALLLMTLVCGTRPLARALTPQSLSEGWYRSTTDCQSECKKWELKCVQDIFTTKLTEITTQSKFETMYSDAFLEEQTFTCNKFTSQKKTPKRAPFVILPQNNVNATTAAKCVTRGGRARCRKPVKGTERLLCYCSAPTPTPTPTPPPPAPTPTPTPPPPASCGVKGNVGSSVRIVNGNNAEPREWVWQVSLQDKKRRHRCGGVLLTPDRVLTAAHCVDDDEPRWAVLGQYSQTKDDAADRQRSFVLRKFIHEHYTQESGGPHDIAILQLLSAVTLGSRVGTVCLPDQDVDLAGLKCWVTGWGRVSSEGEQADILQEAEMEILDFETCKQQRSNVIEEEHICIQDDESSACFGDSGGPLVCDMSSSWTAFGVASFGATSCTSKPKPNVYTSVRANYDWIKERL